MTKHPWRGQVTIKTIKILMGNSHISGTADTRVIKFVHR